MYYDDPQFQKEVLGFLIRKTRQEKGLSLDTLSTELKKSKQYLCEVELGNKGNDEIIQSVFQYLEIDFNFDLAVGNQILHDFDLSIHHYVGMNVDKREEYWKKILDQKDYQNTFFYPIITLVRFIDCLMGSNKIELELKFSECEKMYPLFSRKQKAIFWFFKGMYSKNFLYEDDSIRYFERSLESSSNSEVSAMAFYMIANICEENHHFILAIENASKSIELLEKFNNPKRQISLQIIYGNIFSRMRLVKKFEEWYFIAIETAQLFQDKESEDLALRNLVQSYLNCRMYDKAIQYSKLALEKGDNLKVAYYVLAWSYYKLNQRKEAAYNLSELQKVNDHSDEEINTYEICLKYLLNSKEQESYKKMVKYYEFLADKKVYTEKINVLERMIEYCEKYELYEEGYKYQKELIEILKIH